MDRQKRILAVHDISCVGRCSLTVALPVLCSAGFDTGVLPTAVLSTHTGDFTNYTYRDLTEDILPILRHWEQLDLQFDAIYTGYMVSPEQVTLVEMLFDAFPDALRFVDPVMADNGRLYKGFSIDFPEKIARLCRRAHWMVPNFTEACLLTGIPYHEGLQTPEEVRAVLAALLDMGAQNAVLTGVSYQPGMLGVAAAADGQMLHAFSEWIPGTFHGTGDVFSSGLLAGLLHELPKEKALQTAVAFTCRSIHRTVELGQEVRYGVAFETALPFLIHALGMTAED
ncbi:MAG: pyridoxamine kinase [Christensenellales bacterium]